MRESAVERYLHDEFVKLGGTTRKWVSPGRVGVPDRICILPMGRIYFVEVKTDTGKMTMRQDREAESLKVLGCKVFTVWGVKGVNQLIWAITHPEEHYVDVS